jgi:hypothetical protein
LFYELRRYRGASSDVPGLTIPAVLGALLSPEDRREVEAAEALGIGQYVDLDDLPPATVKPMTARGTPPGAVTAPAAPFTSAGREKGASRE